MPNGTSLQEALTSAASALQLVTVGPLPVEFGQPVQIGLVPPPSELHVTKLISGPLSSTWLTKAVTFKDAALLPSPLTTSIPDNLADDILTTNAVGTVGQIEGLLPIPTRLPVAIECIEWSAQDGSGNALSDVDDYLLVQGGSVGTFLFALLGPPTLVPVTIHANVHLRLVVEDLHETVTLTLPLLVPALIVPSIALLFRHPDFNERADNRHVIVVVPNDLPAETAEQVRDSIGRIVQLTDALLGDTTRVYTYLYTTGGRLREVKRGTSVLRHYDYDQNGNRTFVSGSSPLDTLNGTYDAQDRLVRYGGLRFTYTKNGELTKKAFGLDTTRFEYDPLSNLVSVVLPGPSFNRIDYVIDGRNRRIGRKFNGRLTQSWLYQDQLEPVAQLDSAGAVTARFVYGSRTHVPDYFVSGDSVYRLVTDYLGSVRLVVNASSGTILQRVDYGASGELAFARIPGLPLIGLPGVGMQVASGPGLVGNATNAVITDKVSIGYAGGLADGATGLVRFGARDYDPVTGRWTSKDPITFRGGDTNLYSYVHGDPINWTDPSGLLDIFGFVSVTGTPMPGSPLRPATEPIGLLGYSTNGGAYFGGILAAGVEIGGQQNFFGAFEGVETIQEFRSLGSAWCAAGRTRPPKGKKFSIREVSVGGELIGIAGVGGGGGRYKTIDDYGWFFFVSGGLLGEHGAVGVGFSRRH